MPAHPYSHFHICHPARCPYFRANRSPVRKAFTLARAQPLVTSDRVFDNGDHAPFPLFAWLIA